MIYPHKLTKFVLKPSFTVGSRHWFIDSGYTSDLNCDRNAFTSYSEAPNSTVDLGADSRAQIIGKSDVVLHTLVNENKVDGELEKTLDESSKVTADPMLCTKTDPCDSSESSDNDAQTSDQSIHYPESDSVKPSNNPELRRSSRIRKPPCEWWMSSTVRTSHNTNNSDSFESTGQRPPLRRRRPRPRRRRRAERQPHRSRFRESKRSTLPSPRLEIGTSSMCNLVKCRLS
eukprot:IDg10389t1